MQRTDELLSDFPPSESAPTTPTATAISTATDVNTETPPATSSQINTGAATTPSTTTLAPAQEIAQIGPSVPPPPRLKPTKSAKRTAIGLNPSWLDHSLASEGESQVQRPLIVPQPQPQLLVHQSQAQTQTYPRIQTQSQTQIIPQTNPQPQLQNPSPSVSSTSRHADSITLIDSSTPSPLSASSSRPVSDTRAPSADVSSTSSLPAKPQPVRRRATDLLQSFLARDLDWFRSTKRPDSVPAAAAGSNANIGVGPGEGGTSRGGTEVLSIAAPSGATDTKVDGQDLNALERSITPQAHAIPAPGHKLATPASASASASAPASSSSSNPPFTPKPATTSMPTTTPSPIPLSTPSPYRLSRYPHKKPVRPVPQVMAAATAEASGSEVSSPVDAEHDGASMDVDVSVDPATEINGDHDDDRGGDGDHDGDEDPRASDRDKDYDERMEVDDHHGHAVEDHESHEEQPIRDVLPCDAMDVDRAELTDTNNASQRAGDVLHTDNAPGYADDPLQHSNDPPWYPDNPSISPEGQPLSSALHPIAEDATVSMTVESVREPELMEGIENAVNHGLPPCSERTTPVVQVENSVPQVCDATPSAAEHITQREDTLSSAEMAILSEDMLSHDEASALTSLPGSEGIDAQSTGPTHSANHVGNENDNDEWGAIAREKLQAGPSTLSIANNTDEARTLAGSVELDQHSTPVSAFNPLPGEGSVAGSSCIYPNAHTMSPVISIPLAPTIVGSTSTGQDNDNIDHIDDGTETTTPTHAHFEPQKPVGIENDGNQEVNGDNTHRQAPDGGRTTPPQTQLQLQDVKAMIQVRRGISVPQIQANRISTVDVTGAITGQAETVATLTDVTMDFFSDEIPLSLVSRWVNRKQIWDNLEESACVSIGCYHSADVLSFLKTYETENGMKPTAAEMFVRLECSWPDLGLVYLCAKRENSEQEYNIPIAPPVFVSPWSKPTLFITYY
ncbi:hypothetical protein BJ138DRAFT_650115 [Hygrophoropsis aurantiaca]|uniref:Uncharacterized protein n=1 Tax=Hygrophoropsis aurantiaca TaxID=72124 RepID=A0ACB8A117_9AGAM|nr:hypothetical protein BJ138DRAFT_650115 [Hygrophoropsis aurantiaca]